MPHLAVFFEGLVIKLLVTRKLQECKISMDTNNNELADTKTDKKEKSGCQTCLTMIIVSIIVLFSGCAITICLWPSPPSESKIEKMRLKMGQ